MNANKVLEFNEHLVPTGKVVPFTKFQTTQLFGSTFLDNCFLLNGAEEPACVLENRADKLRLSIWPDETYPYLQIYTPEHRKSIAIENLSSAPDAFNNGIGLLIVSPGETKKFYTTFKIEVYP